MSGVITTDPFEILDAGKTFYDNLYKSKRNSRQQSEQYFKFEDLPMPTLSHEFRQSGEGAISLEECTGRSFKLLPSKYWRFHVTKAGRILQNVLGFYWKPPSRMF